MKAPIHSVKHYVQWTVTPVAVGTTVLEDIVISREATTANLGNEVREGAIVKAVFVELWVIGQSDSASGNVLVSLYKNPGNGHAMTQAAAVDLHNYVNKKNVLYHTQGITNDGVANATPFVRQWFKIPKGKQRFGLGDRLQIATSTQAEAVNYCGFATYKEYT